MGNHRSRWRSVTIRASIIILCIAILAGLSSIEIRSFGQSLREPPTVIAQPAPKRQGFFDYRPGKINRQDNDYGATPESRRSAAVENSIDDLYFWSNVVTLTLLCALAAIVLLQWRAADKREVIAASLIAQLWNGRVSARIEIERRTAEFNQLVEAHNAEVERTLSIIARPGPAEVQATSDLKKTVGALDKKSVKPGEIVPDKSAARPSAIALDTQGSKATDTGSQQGNVILERRVEAMRNTAANPRTRQNDTLAQLEQEKARNQTLKGG